MLCCGFIFNVIRIEPSVFDGLAVVGQNDCKDDRGEIFRVHLNGTREIIPGVPL
jgi:hypothetical protein